MFLIFFCLKNCHVLLKISKNISVENSTVTSEYGTCPLSDIVVFTTNCTIGRDSPNRTSITIASGAFVHVLPRPAGSIFASTTTIVQVGSRLILDVVSVSFDTFTVDGDIVVNSYNNSECVSSVIYSNSITVSATGSINADENGFMNAEGIDNCTMCSCSCSFFFFFFFYLIAILHDHGNCIFIFF